MNSENSVFHFRKFSIQQANTAMKVGTDGVLLGAWTEAATLRNILDVGAGTGIIGLMLAQRFPQASITCIEPDDSAQVDIVRNINQSPFSARVQSANVRMQDFKSDLLYDLIVSNPPYFKTGNAAHGSRGNARHTIGLPHSEFLDSSKRLLTSSGRLSLILPLEEGGELLDMAPQKGFFLWRQCIVYPSKNQTPIRRLLEFGQQLMDVKHSSMCIREGNEYSNAYRNITKEFYLNII